MTLIVQTPAEDQIAAFFSQSVNYPQIQDPFLRLKLTLAAKALEDGLAKGLITMTDQISQTFSWGLKISSSTRPPIGEGIQPTYVFVFQVDGSTLGSWLSRHEDILDATLSFTSKGIQVIFDGRKASSWKKAMFCFEREPTPEDKTEQQWLPLMEVGATFTARRDTVNYEQWHIHHVG